MTGGVGVFICHCGKNIARTVDVEGLRERIAGRPGVAWAEDHMYLCSDPGQGLIRQRIREEGLDGIVVAACSPTLHATTFRRAIGAEGVDPYALEIANIREQCAWVHPDRRTATDKAADLIHAAVEKALRAVPLTPIRVPVTRRAVVIGGGVAGIQTALDIADGGHEVHLVERGPTIGGRMAQLAETFPTLDCSSCILTPRMVEVRQHPQITLHTMAEVSAVSGSVGNFSVTVRHAPRFVREDLCTGCGDCVPVCPEVGPNPFEEGLGARKAIYLAFPQAVPFTYAIDPERCLNTGPLLVCDACSQVCEPRAIDHDMAPREEVIEAGAIVVATGYDTLPLDHFGAYGYDTHADLIDSLMFERLLSASGPTGGVVRRPSDGRIPERVVFVQCAGSRDPERGKSYCSKVCCLYTAKHALLFKEANPTAEVTVFYIDIRAGGKRHEEFIERVRSEAGVRYVRGRVAKIHGTGDRLAVHGVDTLLGEPLRIDADLVVLATAMVPSAGAVTLAGRLRVATDGDGFMAEAHPKLRPVESGTPGVYLAGVAQSPRDISDSVAQASGAAAKVLGLFSKGELVREPYVAEVTTELCRGCEFCLPVCPYGAIEMTTAGGAPVAHVRPEICAGCGACAPVCLPGAIRTAGTTDDTILAQLAAVSWS